ncbi:MAG: EamA family transporter [Desulfobacterales bacterium]|nr:EamA family transporter [Desulfobacterales bacterium]
MLNFILYATTTLIWGSTWLGIKLQLSQVPPILSVGYRFFLASVLLLIYCIVTNRNLDFSRRDHFFLAVQGVTLFGLGYIMSYLATSYLTSGLVAVIFSTILMWNILNLRLFMGQPVAWRAFSGGVLGLAGICILFWHDLAAFTATSGLIGLIIALVGAYLASIGNVVGSRNARCGVPVTQANVFSMAYGAVFCLVIHFIVGGELTMDWTFGYLGPMLYLTVFGSVVAFGCYMLLIGRIGADYAAYVMLLMPVVALVISTFFEKYRWSSSAIFGIAIVLLGNLIILTPAATLEKSLLKVKAN